MKISVTTYNNMGFSKLIVVLFFLHFVPTILSQQNFTNYHCYDLDGTYTQNSTYKTNLNKVLFIISSNTQIDYGFYNFSVGDDSDKVNAIALCRGDLNKTECYNCRNDAITKLTQLCPNQMKAFGWYPRCTLWYSHRFIFGVYEQGTQFKFYTIGDTPVPSQFNQTLAKLLNGVNANASLGDSQLKFATADTSLSSSDGTIYNIFALSQCNPDLTQNICLDCLASLTRSLLDCCGNETTASVAGPSCSVTYKPNRFYNIRALTAPTYSPRTPSGKKSSKVKTVIIIVVISAVALLALAILCYFLLRNRKRATASEETKVDISSIEPLRYDFSTIKAATDNFSQANKLGQGGFGAVYKGKLPDGRDIAVKRLKNNSSGQGEKEFKNEITLLAKLQHRNLVRLFGYCLEKKERILVYEFVPNASLDHFIFESRDQGSLDWNKRRQIIGGIAQGLVYLHEHSRSKIIHRDLKPGNILLDAEMNPKIADFGLAKLFTTDETHDNVSKVAGTLGYMAPEYTRCKQFSVKSDVYSFGILLLEIICGRRNKDASKEFADGLVGLVSKNWSEGTVVSVIDRIMALDASLETEVTRHIQIGLLCVQQKAADRPNTSSVIIWLSTDIPLPSPSFSGYFSQPYQPPQQASDSEQSTLNSYVSSTTIENSTPMLHTI